MSERARKTVAKNRHDQQPNPQSPEPLSDCDSYDDFDPKDLEALRSQPFSTSDELPIFRIQTLSPTSRSLSPIDHISASMLNITVSPCSSSFTAGDSDEIDPNIIEDRISPCSSSDDMDSADGRHFDAFVSLEEIHSQIGTPNERTVRTKLKLETIVEGVFLDTPPKEMSDRFYRDSMKAIQLFSIDKYVQEQQQHQEHRLKRKSQEIAYRESEEKMELDDDDSDVDTHNLAQIIEYTEF